MSPRQDYPPDQHSTGAGALLRQARESHRLTIADVAQAIKLAPRQVEAIEEGDFASLRGQTFARGFVRNYARYLQIDPEPLVQMVDEQLGRAQVDLNPISNVRAPMPAAPSGAPGSLIALVLLALAALAVVVYFDRTRPTPDIAPAAPESARQSAAGAGEAAAARSAEAQPGASAAAPAASGGATQGSAGIAQTATQAPPPTPAAPAPSASRKLVFRFERESWVQVKDGAGNVLTIGTNKAGSTQTVEGKPPLSVTVGNSEFVRLEADGKPIDLKKLSEIGVARFKLE